MKKDGAVAEAIAPFYSIKKRKPRYRGNGFPFSDNY